MKEETHSLKCVYKGVQPFVKVTAYELSAVDCSADRMSGYYGETATLTANVAPAGYNFSGWNITGSQMTGNSFRFQGDVTAKAGYSAIPVVYNLTLQTDGHGTLTANKVTGYAGDTVTLTPTYNTYYRFNNYSNTGGSINGNTFTFGNGNATAKANFKSNNFTATGSYNNTDAFAYRDAGWWTGECDSYCKIGGITGSTPAAWGSVGSTWTPNSLVHNYSITVNAAATSYIQTTTRRNLNVQICSGRSVLAMNGTASQNSTITVSTSYTTTGTAELYVTSLWANTISQTANLGNTGHTAGCSFTATGIAP